MLTLPATLKVFLHLTPVDLRNGFDGGFHDDLGCTVSENRLPRKSSFSCLSTDFLSGTR